MKKIRKIGERLAWGVSVLLLCASFNLMIGCPGVQLGASCTRHADGSISCSIDAHRGATHQEEAK